VIVVFPSPIQAATAARGGRAGEAAAAAAELAAVVRAGRGGAEMLRDFEADAAEWRIARLAACPSGRR
jgi:hypothetical protein